MVLLRGLLVVLGALLLGPSPAILDSCMDRGTNIVCHQLCNVDVATSGALGVIVTGGVLDFRCPISTHIKVGAFYY